MKFDLRCSDGFVSIEIMDYENSAAETREDANWLLCYVTIKAGAFSAEYQASFMTEDFVDFQQQLATVVEHLSGSARFETLEDALQLSIEMKSNGEAVVTGTARTVDSPDTALSFSMASDQSCMSKTNGQLHSVTRAFPVRTL